MKKFIIPIYLLLTIVLYLSEVYNYTKYFYLILGLIGIIHIFSLKSLNGFLLFGWNIYIQKFFGLLLIIIFLKKVL